jgi:hypothetical protein
MKLNLTYAKLITIKSSQFQASRKNELLSSINPRANIFINASLVYITVKTYLNKITLK